MRTTCTAFRTLLEVRASHTACCSAPAKQESRTAAPSSARASLLSGLSGAPPVLHYSNLTRHTHCSSLHLLSPPFPVVFAQPPSEHVLDLAARCPPPPPPPWSA